MQKSLTANTTQWNLEKPRQFETHLCQIYLDEAAFAQNFDVREKRWKQLHFKKILNANHPRQKIVQISFNVYNVAP